MLLKKMRKDFLKTMQKFSPQNSLPLPRNRQKSNCFTSYDVNDHAYSKSTI